MTKWNNTDQPHKETIPSSCSSYLKPVFNLFWLIPTKNQTQPKPTPIITPLPTSKYPNHNPNPKHFYFFTNPNKTPKTKRLSPPPQKKHHPTNHPTTSQKLSTQPLSPKPPSPLRFALACSPLPLCPPWPSWRSSAKRSGRSGSLRGMKRSMGSSWRKKVRLVSVVLVEEVVGRLGKWLGKVWEGVSLGWGVFFK